MAKKGILINYLRGDEQFSIIHLIKSWDRFRGGGDQRPPCTATLLLAKFSSFKDTQVPSALGENHIVIFKN